MSQEEIEGKAPDAGGVRVLRYKKCLPCEKARAARAQAEAQMHAATLDPRTLDPRQPIYVRPAKAHAKSEFVTHQERGGRDYSQGHRRMYTSAIDLLKGAGLPRLDILEVGTGIGYGLGKMLEAGLVRKYFGVEPDPENFPISAPRFRIWAKNASRLPAVESTRTDRA